jgi:hypothetical protein
MEQDPQPDSSHLLSSAAAAAPVIIILFLHPHLIRDDIMPMHKSYLSHNIYIYNAKREKKYPDVNKQRQATTKKYLN